MSPEILEMLVPLLGIAMVGLVASIPLLGLTARFAAKPVIEALIRLREAQARNQTNEEALLLQDRRLSLLEAELQQLSGAVQRLAEAEAFRTQVEAARPCAALPAARALDGAAD